MIGILWGVKQTNRDRLNTQRLDFFQLAPHNRCIRRSKHIAGRIETLVDFDHDFRQFVAFSDVERKKIGPVLIANFEHIGETLGGDKGDSGALSFEQRIGRSSGSQADLDRWDGLVKGKTHQIANGGDRSGFSAGQ